VNQAVCLEPLVWEILIPNLKNFALVGIVSQIGVTDE
jgi:hypothetical protein